MNSKIVLVLIFSFLAAIIASTSAGPARDSCRPCMCTYDYKPVCGTNGRTYGNLCEFRCAQRCDRRIKMASNMKSCKARA
ncbi:unnamed protein product [Allacma fusca]|uniref:Kazal-like domain-containing protein n=1 Tax=Allacma fusca TaxID=39272 RepID=A0A8J2K668_9HEXA|nr:unnamed protein product [Allacma fusca]